MYRFTMPSAKFTKEQRLISLNKQFDDFLNSNGTHNILKILNVKFPLTLNQWKTYLDQYDFRKGQERIKSSIDATFKKKLEDWRVMLYGYFVELGMIKASEFISKTPNHILILGSSYKSSYNRVKEVERLIKRKIISTEHLKSINALGTYRIISPEERANTILYSDKETEFGILGDCFSLMFGCAEYVDKFNLEKNTNKISCIRTFKENDQICYKVFSAPSSNPIERANSNDTYKFYFENSSFKESERYLLVTDNLYRNYQFIPFAMQILIQNKNIDFDIIGCSENKQIVSVEKYNPFSYLQTFNAIIDWIIRFKETVILKENSGSF